MNQEQILGILRHVLAAVGIWLVAAGRADEAQVQELSGAVVAVAAVLWSVWSKKGQ